MLYLLTKYLSVRLLTKYFVKKEDQNIKKKRKTRTKRKKKKSQHIHVKKKNIALRMRNDKTILFT